MHRRLFQLFGLLLLVATAITITVYAMQPTTAVSPLSTTTNRRLAIATETAPVIHAEHVSQAGTIFVEAVTYDADNFNPIYTTNPTSLSVIQKLYPALTGQDPYTGANNGSGLAERWTFDDEGRTLTITLYADLLWSDGEPLTAHDVAFTYALIREPAVASPYRQNFSNIEAVDAVDDRTIQLQLTTADCSIFQSLRQPIIPAHLYDNEIAQFQATDPNRSPSVGAGPFLFEKRSGSRITLKRNERYRLGAPLLERYEFQIIADPTEQRAALEAGEIDLMHFPPEQLAQLQSLQAQSLPSISFYQAPLDSITFLALNLANPQNPQPGRATDSSLLPQEPHQILGSQMVRQALAHALDYDELLNDGFGRQMIRLNGYLLPTVTWAYHGQLSPYSYDPARAAQLLNEAGWVDANSDGIRERDGTTLQLSLLTNQDSVARVHLGEMIQRQLQPLGIAVHFEALPFDALTDLLLGQRYDLVLVGWDTLGAEPSNSDFWLSHQDLPTDYDTNGIGGANFTSYQNVAVDLWLTEARSAADCDGGYRAQRYRQVQERIHEDLPYIMLGSPLQGWAYRSEWQGILPQPWHFAHNVQRWRRAN